MMTWLEFEKKVHPPKNDVYFYYSQMNPVGQITYDIIIDAPVNKVYDTMLGLSDKKTYEQWTAVFNPTSTYQGSWKKGSKILFLGNDNGKKSGMVSNIAENEENRFVSIRHIGIIDNGKEITEGPDVEKMTGLENYRFTSLSPGQTKVTVEMTMIDDFREYFDKVFPKALQELKRVVENR